MILDLVIKFQSLIVSICKHHIHCNNFGQKCSSQTMVTTEVLQRFDETMKSTNQIKYISTHQRGTNEEKAKKMF